MLSVGAELAPPVFYRFCGSGRSKLRPYVARLMGAAFPTPDCPLPTPPLLLTANG